MNLKVFTEVRGVEKGIDSSIIFIEPNCRWDYNGGFYRTVFIPNTITTSYSRAPRTTLLSIIPLAALTLSTKSDFSNLHAPRRYYHVL